MAEAEQNQNAEKQNPEQLVGELWRVYTSYLNQPGPKKEKGLASLLSGWFMPPGYSASTPEDEKFVADVGRITGELAGVLAAADPAAADGYAREALQIMIHPPSPAGSASQSLYLCAVLEQGVALTEFLEGESRSALQAMMKKAENPRRFLPSQRRLYDALAR